ncbi:hypothetical protein SUGI_0684360 [Cryptomeria japonica]|nr:hypothetical protein SUGI_0684360 [Cryptomeria japonica]
MKRWLSCARSRLGKTLSFKDKYIWEVCRAFQGNRNSTYTETFISKACPLKAESDKLLDLTETTIQKVKHRKVQLDEENDILKEMHDIHKELSHLSELLCPRHEKHKDCDLEWLENDAVGCTSIRLQESRHRFNRFKYTFEDDIRTDTECIQQLSTGHS